jgi:alpha-tubulin suppressor-like RCC1 family protein
MRAIWLLFLTACSLNVDYSGTYYQCNPDGSCPTGYECVGDVCVPTDPVPPACSQSISAGGAHSCSVRNDGSVWCWGANEFGQLGDGTATSAEQPVQVVGVTNAVAVGAGELFSCALDDMGQVFCWGNNSAGQLGDGTNSDSRTAVAVRDLTGVAQLSVGADHTCVVKSDGSVACWGSNDDGQLGDGSMTARSTPIAVASLAGVREVSAGNDLTCAALMDGSAQCWGENNEGELGVGDTEAHPQPTPVLTVSGVEHVAAGDDLACFLNGDGFVRCSGLNDEGQLGDGTQTSSSSPVGTLIPLGGVAIDAGARHACVVDKLDQTWCWGYGGDGRLLDATNQPRLIPVRGIVEDVAAISAGNEHTCVLDHAGAIRCAGFNRRGQLGDGRPVTSGEPVVVDGVTDAVAIVAGARHTCAAQADGKVMCWGENDDGEAGNGSYIGQQSVPHVVFGISHPKQMVAGDEHTCAWLEDDSTFCWGDNERGQLGNGTTTSSAQPRAVFGIGATPTALSVGDDASCALIAGGASCWGEGFDSTPVSVADVVDISRGDAHVCAVNADKTVACYGDNDNYQLGDGTQTMQVAPGVPAEGITNAVEVLTRGDSSCAVLGDGTARCWGLNADGRLGVGNTNYQIHTPTAIMGLSDVMKLAMGWEASCALKSDGTVWCWGANYFGQVGDASYQMRSAPVQIAGLSGVKDVASGGSHSCAIGGDGKVVCWGLGASGQLGNGIREIVRPVGVRMTCP